MSALTICLTGPALPVEKLLDRIARAFFLTSVTLRRIDITGVYEEGETYGIVEPGAVFIQPSCTLTWQTFVGFFKGEHDGSDEFQGLEPAGSEAKLAVVGRKLRRDGGQYAKDVAIAHRCDIAGRVVASSVGHYVVLEKNRFGIPGERSWKDFVEDLNTLWFPAWSRSQG